MRNRETGELIFHTILPYMRCKNCSHLVNTGDSCPHIYRLLPKHKSLQKMQIAITLMGGDKIMINQELFGMVQSSTSYMFREFVQEFMRLPRYTFKNHVRMCHTYIDPSGGGAKSDFVLATHSYEEGKYALLAISRLVSRTFTDKSGQALTDMLQEHYYRLWEIYPQSYFMVYTETSSDNFAPGNLANILRVFFQVHGKGDRIVFAQGIAAHPEVPGVSVTHADKEAWTNSLQRILRDKRLHFADRFLMNEDAQDFQEEFMRQLSDYTRWVKLPENNPFGKPVIEYGGKQSGKDDMVTAVAGSIHHHKIKMQSKEYLEWCVERSIYPM